MKRNKNIKKRIQKPDIFPVAEGPAVKVTVTSSRRQEHIRLHIEVSDKLEEITYSEVLDDSMVFSDNEPANYNVLKLKKIVTIPSSHLVTPQRHIKYCLQQQLRKRIQKLLADDKRYTTFRGITTSWDKSVDRDVWTTNIDTVFMHKTMEENGILFNTKFKKVLEVGTGGGHLSAALAASLPNLEQLTVTDISKYALSLARRNIESYIQKRGGNISLRYYWGKGIRTVSGNFDLIVVSPPYIPVPPFMRDKHENDPYSGTGLIREILEIGIDKLNPQNPHACILIEISSMAQKDFERYIEKFRDRLTINRVGHPLVAPLKIRTINQRWKDWLVGEGGLVYHLPETSHEEPYWHTIQAYVIKPKR